MAAEINGTTHKEYQGTIASQMDPQKAAQAARLVFTILNLAQQFASKLAPCISVVTHELVWKQLIVGKSFSSLS